MMTVMMKEAMLYEKREDNQVRCNLCAHRCVIDDQKRGLCGVRKNEGGVLYALAYGKVVARHVDPIEKKPLYHFAPGASIYSIALPGCNFHCEWCQNADISQMGGERLVRERDVHERDVIMGREIAPEVIVESARQMRCRGIAYTYTEPTVFFEYAYDVAQMARDEGLKNIFVTNGYMTADMLDLFGPCLDAANVDLKSFRDDVYRQHIGGRLQPVLESLRKMREIGIWLEVTTLVVPGVNDNPDELRDIAQFIAQELGTETPWHVSRFFPTYQKKDTPPTPLSVIQETEEIGREAGLFYVYAGNVAGETNTPCHQCGRTLIQRSGYHIIANHIDENGHCAYCGAPVAGVDMGA
jgi:pyruvate formate lyase activating enzyme